MIALCRWIAVLVLVIAVASPAWAEPPASEAPVAAEAAPVAEPAPATDSAPAPVAPAEPPVDPSIGPPGPPPPPEQVEGITQTVSSTLRCPVCQGLSVADSPSESAILMKGRIRELVAQGYDQQQIQDYFVGRYGEWVLLEPPLQRNWLVWLAPAFALGLGLALVAATVARWRREPEHLPSDTGALPKDKYEERLLAEIEE